LSVKALSPSPNTSKKDKDIKIQTDNRPENLVVNMPMNTPVNATEMPKNTPVNATEMPKTPVNATNMPTNTPANASLRTSEKEGSSETTQEELDHLKIGVQCSPTATFFTLL